MKNEQVNLDDLGFTEQELFSHVDNDVDSAEKITAPRYSYWKSVFRVFFKKKINIVVLCLLAIVIFIAYIYPLISNYDAYQNLLDSGAKHLRPLAAMQKFGYNLHWILGTGASGNSTFDAVWSGAKISISLAFMCALINMTVGVVIGAIWGFSKKMDVFMTEVYNIIENIPSTVLRMLITYIMKPSVSTLIFTMCITNWVGMALWIRNLIIIIRDREYNLASRCLGTPTGRIIVRNLLPQIVSVVMMDIALSIPDVIGAEVFLTYIGLGLPVQTPLLGNLIDEGRRVMMNPSQTYQLVFPAIVVAAITISFYTLGNKFADASDPRNHL